jgi:RNA polymerase sigma-70 factor (ECF subfamily)
MYKYNKNIKQHYSWNKIEEIYTLYRKLLYLTAYNILKDHQEAEDAVHSAIIKIYNNSNKIDDVRCKKTRAFVVIIVRNIAINIYNRKKMGSEINIELSENITKEEHLIDPEQHMLRIDNAEWVARKLAQINPEYADIIVMRYTYQFSISEIACLINTSENNIRVKLYRARKALREVMKDE